MESASAHCTTERGAQWCAAQHANGKRQSAAHNGVRRGKRMASVRTRRKRSAARHANGKRQNAAHNGVRRGMRMASVRTRCTTERGAQRSAAWHADGKRQSAAHNGARRGMRMESASARCTTERNAVTTQRKLRPSVHFRRRVRAQAKRRAGGRRLARPYRRGVALRLYCRFGPERPPL